MDITLERKFTVKGLVSCRYASDGTAITNDLGNIAIELWRKSPLDIIFLGSGITNTLGEFKIEFEVDSPNPIIENGKINDVFIRAYYNGVEIQVDQSIEAGGGNTDASGRAPVWRNGAGIPDNNIGIDGDYYLNNASGTVYERQLGAYVLVASIKGANGIDGLNGTNGATGATGPKGDTGLKGDKGDNGSAGAAGGTGPKGDKGDRGDNGSTGAAGGTGPKGDKGDNGTNGVDGKPGSQWLYGTVDPDVTMGGVTGDYYLNTLTGSVFRMGISDYEWIGNIRGRSAPELRTGTELFFDINSEYGSEEYPESDNISMIFPDESTRGVTATVVHMNDKGEPEFSDEFLKLASSMEYKRDRINYIICNFRNSGLVTYKIDN